MRNNYIIEEPGTTYWEKYNDSDKVWWKYISGTYGEMIFSFDKKTEFNFWTDYPKKLTPEQKAIFDAENEFIVKELKGQ